MNSLDRKLFRDLWQARGQVIAIFLTGVLLFRDFF